MAATPIKRKFDIAPAANSVAGYWRGSIEFRRCLIDNAGRENLLIVDRGVAHRARKAPAPSCQRRVGNHACFSADRNPEALVWMHRKLAGGMAATRRGRFREEGSPRDA